MGTRRYKQGDPRMAMFGEPQAPAPVEKPDPPKSARPQPPAAKPEAAAQPPYRYQYLRVEN